VAYRPLQKNLPSKSHIRESLAQNPGIVSIDEGIQIRQMGDKFLENNRLVCDSELRLGRRGDQGKARLSKLVFGRVANNRCGSNLVPSNYNVHCQMIYLPIIADNP
jgi:hypothetical protein